MRLPWLNNGGIVKNNHLGRYVRSRRQEEALTLRDIARAMGYRNINKGMRRIAAVEQGNRYPFMIEGLLGIPGFLDPARVEELLQQEEAEYQQWLDEPIPMELVLTVSSRSTEHVPVPPDVQTQDDAVHYGLRVCGARMLYGVLHVSRRLRIHLSPYGWVRYYSRS